MPLSIIDKKKIDDLWANLNKMKELLIVEI